MMCGSGHDIRTINVNFIDSNPNACVLVTFQYDQTYVYIYRYRCIMCVCEYMCVCASICDT